jgi:CRISPR-associated endoribonuclease Cas6
MRVRLIFGLKNKGAYVPFHHQFLIQEFLAPYIEKYESVIGKTVEHFNFSALKGQTRVGKDGLHFYSSKVTLVLSSLDEKLIDSVVQGIYAHEEVLLGKLELNPLNVDIEAIPKFTSESKYICLSPLSIVSYNEPGVDAKRFISPTLDEFSDHLFESTMLRMEKAGYSQDDLAKFFKFQVVPDAEYLGKIKNEEKKFARIFPVYIEGQKVEVRGYTFPFTLYADPEVQKFVFNSGLGVLTERGFGMLDIANADPNSRITPYEIKK